MAGQTCMGIAEGHIICSLEYLNNCFVFINFNDTTDFLGSVVHVEFYDFFVGSIFDAFQNYERAVYFT